MNPRDQHSHTIENSGYIKMAKTKTKTYIYICVNMYVNMYVLCDYVGKLWEKLNRK